MRLILASVVVVCCGCGCDQNGAESTDSGAPTPVDSSAATDPADIRASEPIDSSAATDPADIRVSEPIDSSAAADSADRRDVAVPMDADSGGLRDAAAPDAAPPIVPPCAPDALSLFTRAQINPPWRDSEDYAPPPQSALDALRASLMAHFDGDMIRARTLATSAGYQLCAGEADGDPVLVGYPVEDSSGHARWIRRLSDRPSRLILEAPHGFFDIDTLAESVFLFREVRAHALIVTGTHRCAIGRSTACDGRTTVCTGEREPFRVSDMAHTDDAYFHAAHEAFFDGLDERHWVISIHGFSDEGISLSNGTTHPTAANAPVARLASALSRRFPDHPVTTCSDYPGARHETRQCATTNTQGRDVNGADPACTTQAEQASERFVHIEQSRAVRRSMNLVAEAMAEVAP